MFVVVVAKQNTDAHSHKDPEDACIRRDLDLRSRYLSPTCAFALGRCAIAYGPDRMIETWGAEFGGEYRGRLEDKIGEGARLMATLVRVATAFRPLVGRRFPCVR